MACIGLMTPRLRCVLEVSSLWSCLRKQSNLKIPARLASTHNCAWQIYEYGNREVLTYTNTRHMPIIRGPNELLIEVLAASVNPIDVRMRDGYGSSLINILRSFKNSLDHNSEFPLILGRDFSGIVVAKGHGVQNFNVGDEVWGALGGERQGTHAHYTVAAEDEISLKPKSLAHIDAASLPYVAMTTHSAFCKFAQINEAHLAGKRVLVIGGAGGIGTFTIQWLKALDAHVTSVCSTDGVDLVSSLGADDVIDYKTSDVTQEVQLKGGFDVVYDPVGGKKIFSYCTSAVKPGGYVINLTSPLLSNSDKYGLPLGLARSSTDLACSVSEALKKQAFYRWAFFVPNGEALGRVADMVDAGLIQPIVESVFSMNEVPAAYDKVGLGSGRGKTVIDMTSNDSSSK